jgi:hypothetical protein
MGAPRNQKLSPARRKGDRMSLKTLYNTDFAAWSDQTAALIRAGQFAEIDFQKVAEEIEDMGKSERAAVWSHLNRLLLHKIKQIIQPERDSASWRVSIESARQAIRQRIKSSPSLRPYLQQNLQEIYREAIKLALIETEMEFAAVPDECPWDLGALLDEPPKEALAN